jgi:hypothetical protein
MDLEAIGELCPRRGDGGLGHRCRLPSRRHGLGCIRLDDRIKPFRASDPSLDPFDDGRSLEDDLLLCQFLSAEFDAIDCEPSTDAPTASSGRVASNPSVSSLIESPP